MIFFLVLDKRDFNNILKLELGIWEIVARLTAFDSIDK